MSGDFFFLIKNFLKFILFFGHTTQHVKSLFLKQESNPDPLACFPIHWTAWKVPGDNFGYQDLGMGAVLAWKPGMKPGMLLTIPQCIEQSPQQRIIWPRGL